MNKIQKLSKKEQQLLHKELERTNEKRIEQRDIILAINPVYAGLIRQKKKKWEYRKKIWSSNKIIGKIYLYETSPIQKIKCYFTSNFIIKGKPKEIWHLTHKNAGISQKEFNNYFNHKKKGYALQISRLKRFQSPKDPFKLIDNFHPPQNFMYTNWREIK